MIVLALNKIPQMGDKLGNYVIANDVEISNSSLFELTVFKKPDNEDEDDFQIFTNCIHLKEISGFSNKENKFLVQLSSKNRDLLIKALNIGDDLSYWYRWSNDDELMFEKYNVTLEALEYRCEPFYPQDKQKRLYLKHFNGYENMFFSDRKAIYIIDVLL